MHVNKPVVVATIVLIATGVYTVKLMKPDGSGTRGRTITRVLVGGYLLAIIASIVDLVGGPAAAVASGLMMLAVAAALFAVLPDLLARLPAQQQQAKG